MDGPAPVRRTRREYIGRYRVLDRLGKGSMGVVYAARDEIMERDVAIKVLMTDVDSEPEIRARFMREAQVAARLSHRNIVTIFDVGEEDGRLFIVMELLRGVTLAEAVKGEPLPIEQTLDIAVEVCDALAVSSAAGIYHRDVKPGNLFVTDDGGVKVLDFGIARLANSSMTASGFIIGTPDYMSPEQARGEEVDERSDIFSTGAVLYFLLTARKPFQAPDLPSVLNRVVSEDPAPLPADVPPALARIVTRALQKEAGQRFQAFQEFHAELTAARRAYQAETRALAARAFDRAAGLASLVRAVDEAAAVLGLPPDAGGSDWAASLADVHPALKDRGVGALHSTLLPRAAVLEAGRRIDDAERALSARSADLQAARADYEDGLRLLESGDAAAALVKLESAAARAPSPEIGPLIDRCRFELREVHELRDRVAALLQQARDERREGRLDVALAIAHDALALMPHGQEAQRECAELQELIHREAQDRRRQASACIRAAAASLATEEFDEAARHLEEAEALDPSAPELPDAAAQLDAARRAHEALRQSLRHIREQVEIARRLFDAGEHGEALALVDELAEAYPDARGVAIERARLRAADDRLRAEAESRCRGTALAEEAEAAWAAGDAALALTLAGEAMGCLPVDPRAIRLAALAKAALRDAEARAQRAARARELLDAALASAEDGRLDRAIAEARDAVDQDPDSDDAAALVADLLGRQASAAHRAARELADARRASDVAEVVADGVRAARAGDQLRARRIAEDVLTIDPANTAALQLLSPGAAALAASSAGDDDTVAVPATALPAAAAVPRPAAWRQALEWVIGWLLKLHPRVAGKHRVEPGGGARRS